MSLSVVIPVYNQGAFLAGTLEEVRKEFSDIDLQIVIVDDGSTQDTDLLEAAASSEGLLSESDISFESKTFETKLVSLGQNQGKGAAVKAGVLAADREVILYTDADLSYSVEFLRKLYSAVKQGADAAIGVRDISHRAGLIRGLGTRYLRWLVKVWVLGRYVDTQCGAKAFSSAVAKAIFEKVQVRRFAFDVEVFAILAEAQKNMAEARNKQAEAQKELIINEFQVSPVAREGSSVRIVKDGIRFMRDLAGIRRRLKNSFYLLFWVGSGYLVQ